MKKQILTLVLSFIGLTAMAQSTQVMLSSGMAEGVVNNGIISYKGIPYAHAERFQRPMDVEPWQGVRKFDTYGQMSSQMMMAFGQQSAPNMGDDCQNLNVWTPAVNDGKKRPVMVWLHGGGFESGSSYQDPSMDGENLSKQGDVVVVSINHRLNILGFLDLSAYGDKYRHSGNAGLIDIISALRWIHNNIEVLGGDPGNITLFGESGGGAKIIVLAASPFAKGTFQKGIIESGAVESLGMLVTPQSTARMVTESLLKKLNLDAAHVDDLITMPYNQLQAAGSEALREVATQLGLKDGFNNPGNMSWAPTVDGEFLIEQPVTDHTASQSHDIALMIGTNFSEMNGMAMMFSPDSQFDNKTTWTDEQKRDKLTQQFGDKADEVVKAFKAAYPGRSEIDALYVDSWIRSNSLKYLGIRAKEGGAPVYSYVFNYETNPMMMVPHTAEIAYVFNNLGKNPMMGQPTDEAKQVAQVMSQAWINFAKTGNPSQAGLEWPAFTTGNRVTMVFDKKSQARTAFDDQLMKLLVPDYQFIY
ncbi:MAG: carboxylesterase/lipase family protein [Bacteroidaceae bacterium]|nr:carboxylesterase/lipase family protein [Bacteroidaceae bacterium]